MSAHLTEEEQLEALKRWWNENGKSTVVGVAVVVAGYFGWQGWEANQQRQAEIASNSYQDIMEALEVAPGQPLSEEKRATVVHLSEGLKADHENSLYASQAALFLAKMAVEKDELGKAAAELQWVIERNVDGSLTRLAKNRLARVLLAQQDYDAALALVADSDSGAFKSLFAESRGDILLAKGDTQQARAAYELAQQSMTEADRSRFALLSMKLDDLKTASVVVEASEAINEDSQQENNEAGE
ncbi:MAG: YfgM family protein [Candidatus Pelagadaptatus aseana]|uniref:YfgM family protein n=1 Tax=Candidatus Pelagadaptatus aseana TaxID=3120508 RepID=UPI0039B14EE5